MFETSATNYTVNNVKPFTEYHCMVAAATSVGLGPFSAVLSATTPEDGSLYMLHLPACNLYKIYIPTYIYTYTHTHTHSHTHADVHTHKV